MGNICPAQRQVRGKSRSVSHRNPNRRCLRRTGTNQNIHEARLNRSFHLRIKDRQLIRTDLKLDRSGFSCFEMNTFEATQREHRLNHATYRMMNIHLNNFVA